MTGLKIFMTQELGPRKVIGLDSWTGGANHYGRLVESFRKKGLELTLIHLGSWGADEGRPEKETIGNLKVRDISSYTRMSFPEILEQEKPSVVIFLSLHTFAHRAFNRYCHIYKVPTIHLYHGLVGVQHVSDGSTCKVRPAAQMRFIADRIMKALKYVWPIYMGSLWRSGASAGDWLQFLRDIVAGAIGSRTRTFAKDARADMCCVYADPDINHAVRRYGYAKKDVIVVGNPDLLAFGLRSDILGSQLSQAPGDRPDVMYADTGLVYTGYVFSSEEEFVRHMITTRGQLESQGKHLIFKPHPQHLMNASVISSLIDEGVDICSNADFLPRLKKCCACICEPTSISVIPALLGMPLFLANYGCLKEQRYGEVVTSYPRASLLSDVRDLSSLLENGQAGFDPVHVRQWIEHNAGPLPPEEMPDRVVEVVLSLIEENAVSGIHLV